MVHAARYFELFEDAFLQWADLCAGGYDQLRREGQDLVVLESHCRHFASARLGTPLEIAVTPVHAGPRSFTIGYRVRTPDGLAADARITYGIVGDGDPVLPSGDLEAALVDAPRRGVASQEAARALLARLHGAQSDYYAGGSVAALEDVLHPEVAWHIPGHSPIAGDYQGIAEVLAYMARRRDLAQGTFRMHPAELLFGDVDHIASLTDGTATIGGHEQRWSTVGLYQVEDGRIRECRLIPFGQEAFDRVWAHLGPASP
jgi:hypothetical protein